MRKLMFGAGLLAVVLVAGCASPHVVEVARPQDDKLSCAELEREMEEAEGYRRAAEKEKGVTGTNVAAALFFPLAIAGTYSNIGDAVDAANERKRRLLDIYNDKNCGK